METEELNPNPIVLLASFLLFLSYFYNKVCQPRHQSFDQTKRHEQYTLQDHYTQNPPHIHTVTPQEYPNFLSEGAFREKPKRQQSFRDMRPDNIAPKRYVPLTAQNNAPFQDEPLSPDSEGWPSRELDLNLSENLSAIPNTTRNNIPSLSLNNSFFDNSITNQLRNEGNREEHRTTTLLDAELTRRREATGSNPQSRISPRNVVPKTGLLRMEAQKQTKKKARRGHVYQDSSDTDTEMREISPIEKRNGKHTGDHHGQKHQGHHQHGNKEESMQVEKAMIKQKDTMQTEDSRMNIRGKPNPKLNETNYEPEVTKKRQYHPIKGNGNYMTEPKQETKMVVVQEIFDDMSAVNGKRQERYRKGTSPNESKIEQQNGYKKIKTGAKTGVKSTFMPDDNDPRAKQKADAALRKELREKKFAIDSSYMSEYSSDLNLKKYVAKKTVQEQAFRISALPSTAESGKSTVASVPSSIGSNLIPSKDDATKPADAQPKSDLFKTNTTGGSGLFGPSTSGSSGASKPSAAASASGTSGSMTASLFGPSADKPAATQNPPTLEKKESTAPAPPTEQKSGLFQNLNTANKEEKKEAAPVQTSNTNTAAAPQKPLFLGSAGLFEPDDNVPLPENPIMVTRNQSIMQLPAGQEVQPQKTSSLFQQESTVFSAPTTNPPAETKSLFSNAQNTGTTGSSKSMTETLFGKKEEPAKTTAATTQPQSQMSTSLFGNLNSIKPTEEKKPATEQKPGGLFSSLSSFQNLTGNKEQQAQQSTPQPPAAAQASTNSFASIFANAPGPGQDKPAPPSGLPPKKDEQTNPEQKPSTSGLFGPIQTNTQAPAQGGSGGIGGNWLNQIQSESKPNDGGSIFSRLGAQPAAVTTQPAANSLFATKQLSEAQEKTTLNFGSPQKPAGAAPASNLLFGNKPTGGGDSSKPSGLFSTIMGNTGGSSGTSGSSGLFSNLNSAGNAGGNAAGGNAGGAGSGMFSSLFGNANNTTGGNTSSLFGSK